VAIKVGGHPCTPTCPLAQSIVASLPPPLSVKRKRDQKRKKEKEKRKKGKCRDLGSVASRSSLSHGRTGLDPFKGYAGSPKKPHEPRVHYGGGARGLPCARRPHVLHTRGRLRGDLRGLLRMGIRWTIVSVSSLIVVVLWPRVTQSDALEGPAHCRLPDFVRGLPRGCP
jgi:hypothetical protein